MSGSNRTPEEKKTRFGRVPDFNKAFREMDEVSLGELVGDIADYEGSPYETAQDVARAFYGENSERYNKHQMDVREVAKKKVDKHSQPDWAWDLLSVYSEDLGKRVLDIPSGGSNKGLLVDEDFEHAFLYSKKADEISAVDHVRRWYDNGRNMQAIGYILPSERLERTTVDVGSEDVPVLIMDYNSEMVLDSKIEDFLDEEFGENADSVREKIPSRNKWVEDSQTNRRNILNEKGVNDIETWLVGLEFLTENGYVENWGPDEYKFGRDNTAIDPLTMSRLVVDLGEYREDEEESNQDEDFERNSRLSSTNQTTTPENSDDSTTGIY